ncbi:MAG: hemerythrin family protein [Burkholderiaceae bacterium]
MHPSALPPQHQITFDPEWRIGLIEVDRQHAALIATLNRLIADDDAEPASEFFATVLTRLGRDLMAHFRHEESCFVQLGVPQDLAAAHVAAHSDILSQWVGLNFELMRAQPHTRAGVLVVLRGWIADHIVAFDLGLKRYVPQ